MRSLLFTVVAWALMIGASFWLFIGVGVLFVSDSVHLAKWSYYVAWFVLFGLPSIILLSTSFQLRKRTSKSASIGVAYTPEKMKKTIEIRKHVSRKRVSISASPGVVEGGRNQTSHGCHENEKPKDADGGSINLELMFPEGWSVLEGPESADRKSSQRKETLKTEGPLYRDPSSFSSEIMDNVVYFLRTRNYEAESFNGYIVAWHKERTHRLLVKIDNPESCEQYREFGAVILPYYRFRQLIPKLDRATEGGFPDTSQLNTDVITSFGWHAYVEEETRHRALEYASEVWGSSHILNLLGWLRNTWPNNPKLSHYADVVEADYDWFESECCTSNYRRRKIHLIKKLESELVLLGIPSQFQRFFRNIDPRDRCFIVTP